MFTLPKLPYAQSALEPHISAETMALHYGKHHKGYVDKLNTLLKNDPMADLPLEEVIRTSRGVAARQEIFNNAAQVWNHSFFWKSMDPDGGGAPKGPIKKLVTEHFGSGDAFHDAFCDAGAKHFGSGWIWLVYADKALHIETTHDAEMPHKKGATAMLCCDLWEHAYYLDYQNKRPDFIATFLKHLVNWDFANAHLEATP